jgi:hypothetical protein
VVLALLSRKVGPHVMTADMRRNVDALAVYLKGQQTGTGLGVLAFALFSPLPSNQLFIAAGLAHLDLRLTNESIDIASAQSSPMPGGNKGATRSTFGPNPLSGPRPS